MIRSSLCVLFVVFFMSTARGYGAEQNNSVMEASWLRQWMGQETATGGWGGLRQRLGNQGVTVSSNFTTDISGNPSGGLGQAARYAGFLEITAALDLEKIASIKGLSLKVSNYVASGSNLSDVIGNFYGVQEIYTPGNYYFGELDFSLSLPGEKVTLEAGRLFAGDVFATSKLWQYYLSSINNNLNLSSNIFFPHFRTVAWGARATFEPNSRWQLISGIYNADPNVAKPRNNGVYFSVDGNYGCLVLNQLTYKHHQGRREYGLPGSATLGGYYESSKFPGLAEPDRTWHGNYGFYFVADQMLCRGDWPEFVGPSHLRSEAGYSERAKHPYYAHTAIAADRPTGLTAWLAAYAAPQEETNTQTYQFTAGLVYQGLFPNRNRDVTAFCVIYGLFSNDLPGQDAETVLELNHRFQISPWCYITPDIQYVFKPNGQSSIENALVLGMESSINF